MKSRRYEDWAWQQDIKPPVRKFVFLAVARMADNTGVCVASVKRIMKATGLSRRSVLDHLSGLEADEYLVSQSRRKANGRQAVNAYYLASSPCYHDALYQKAQLKEALQEREMALS